MPSITFSDLMTNIYTLVDDWYKDTGKRLLKGKVGTKPIFSDSEMITLMVAADFFGYNSETQFLNYVRANHLDLFSQLVDQSQFNRRARNLRLLVEELRRYWVCQLGVTNQHQFLLDTKPVPVVGYTRSKRHSQFAGQADYGFCASRQMKYFGYKLVLLSDLHGVPLMYDLVPAHTDDREAAEVVLDYVRQCDIFADKGFIGDDWQREITCQTGNHLWTHKRLNQHQQNPKAFDELIGRVRERIESTFNELQNVGRNLERLLTKTVVGLCTRIISKMASYTLKVYLRRFFGINVQTFTATDARC